MRPLSSRPRALALAVLSAGLLTLPTAGALTPAATAASAAADGSAWASSATLDRRLRDGAIVESSGLAHSTYARRVLWTHNDSGDSPRVFAVDKRGRTRAVVRLAGASAVDWEDMAVGRRHQLWVGDIGDNGRRRSSIALYRFREPRTLADKTVAATRFTLTYPDGAHDAEGLMVRRSTGRVFVITKSTSGAGIYRAPKRLSSTSVNRLTRVGAAPSTITAAAYAPGSKRFVLASYTRVYLYDGLRSQVRSLSKPSTQQGESVEYNRRGSRLFIGSEGSNSPVYRLPRP